MQYSKYSDTMIIFKKKLGITEFFLAKILLLQSNSNAESVHSAERICKSVRIVNA
jgi:hypothetical protein